MDPAELRYLEDDDTPVTKIMKGATKGSVAGTIYGTIVATWWSFYIGVEQLLQNYRMKRAFVNGAVGGLVAGASVVGYRARNISTEISAGAAFAVTCSLIDIGVKRQESARNIILTRLRKGPALIHEQCLPSEMEKLGLMGDSSDLFMIL